MTLLQCNMFGPPEDVTHLSARDRIKDDAPVPSERELLWPADLVELLGPELLERLYGDIPRRTRLTIAEICRRLRCGHSHAYNLITEGSLDATDARNPNAQQPYLGIYRYSLVRFCFNREFIQQRLRGNLPPEDLDRCVAAAEKLRKQRMRRTA